jgi:putative membrane protein
MSEAILRIGESDSATSLAKERTEMATQRTSIAADRTLMAWIRTSLSMISFGFAIYKFLQALSEAEKLTGGRPNAPRNLGLALITVGTAALAVAIIQHLQFVRRLQMPNLRLPWSLAVIVAIFVVLIGLLPFVGVLFHTGPF